MLVVTGATGHIGNTLVRELVTRGHRVRCLALGDETSPALDGLAVEVVTGDVREPSSLDAAFAGAAAVFHLASLIALGAGHEQRLEEVNVAGTANVITACRRAGVRRLVYTSSIHAWVEPPHGTPLDESAPLDPTRITTAYGRSKARATALVLEAVAGGLEAVVVSPTGVVGPYDFVPSEIGRLILAVARRRLPVIVPGAYDYVDVRDVAWGLVSAWERGRTGENYILAGERVTVSDFVRWVAEAAGVCPPRWVLPLPVALALAAVTQRHRGHTRGLLNLDAVRTLASNSWILRDKAARELGYRPRPVRTSVFDAVEWFRARGLLPSGTCTQ